MDKHWLNLLQVDTKARHYGTTQKARHERAPKGTGEGDEPERWELEAGYAFCSRYYAFASHN